MRLTYLIFSLVDDRHSDKKFKDKMFCLNLGIENSFFFSFFSEGSTVGESRHILFYLHPPVLESPNSSPVHLSTPTSLIFSNLSTKQRTKDKHGVSQERCVQKDCLLHGVLRMTTSLHVSGL